MDNIRISLSESGPRREISEVRIDGVIDTLTAGELEEVIDSLLKRGRYRIVIDLAGVDYISSAGWGIFISHIKDVRTNSGDIKLANMLPNVYEIYELLEFDNVLQAYQSIDEARDRFVAQFPAGELKKKDSQATRMTMVDTLVRSHVGDASALDDELSAAGGGTLSAETRVLRSVKQDPFLTISEIKDEVNRYSDDDSVGWWHVFGILRRHGLLKKRSRFRYAKGHR